MKLTTTAVQDMLEAYPNFVYSAENEFLEGELDFGACYDQVKDKLSIKNGAKDDCIRTDKNYIQDVYVLRVDLCRTVNGWPRVCEIGGRLWKIRVKLAVHESDLHLYPDGAFCLGLKLAPERRLSLVEFARYRVTPFLYRLSYVEKLGLEAARRDLWAEYSHGQKGKLEHRRRLKEIARSGAGRNDPCPCGAGRKFKKCCWDEVREFLKSSPAGG